MKVESVSPIRRARKTRRGRETVLVVSDAPMVREEVARILKKLAYRVMEAADAGHVRRCAQQAGPIHLLILDVFTVETHDVEFVLWFRAMFPETEVLVTGSSFWKLDFHLGSSQHINFLVKPFTHTQLTRTVRQILA